MKQLAEGARKKEVQDYRDRCRERFQAFAAASAKQQLVFAPEEDDTLRNIMFVASAPLRAHGAHSSRRQPRAGSRVRLRFSHDLGGGR